jgi:hypothetical protein
MALLAHAPNSGMYELGPKSPKQFFEANRPDRQDRHGHEGAILHIAKTAGLRDKRRGETGRRETAA